jgi:cytochrome c
MRKMISTLSLVSLGLGLSAPALADPEADMTKAGCNACHTKDKKLVGPSYKEIAAKNKGQAEAVASLTAKARAGGKGVYGPIPMPPNPVAKIGDAELKAAVEWILKQ